MTCRDELRSKPVRRSPSHFQEKPDMRRTWLLAPALSGIALGVFLLLKPADVPA
jgi:hypothetical protein